LKSLILPLLKVEAKETAPPAGGGGGFQVFRACPAFLSYTLFFWKLYAAAWAIGVLVGSMVLLLASRWLALVVAPLVLVAAFKAVVLYVATRLGYEMRWYVVSDRSLLIREGVWVVREITLTFANAQNVRVTQGLLQRWFGFANVEIDTAGGGGAGHDRHQSTQPHRAVLRGLDNAPGVRDLILEHLRRHRSTGLGDPDDHAARDDAGRNRALLNEIRVEAARLRRTLAGPSGA
jgi:uncharacterized membrane protein YdbT with pleckstrin-like domain